MRQASKANLRRMGADVEKAQGRREWRHNVGEAKDNQVSNGNMSK